MEKRIYLTGILIFLCNYIIRAQQDSIFSKQLNEVIIAATKTEKQALDVGRSVTIITQDEIKNGMYNSLSELLAVQTGIYIIGQNENPGMTQSLFMRGANNNSTAIYIDGVQITDVTSPNSALDFNELSLSGIDKIEIVRGSHSTVYGPSAIGGVIQIYTKKNAQKGMHANANYTAGTFGKNTFYNNGELNVNYAAKKNFYFNAGANYINSNGLDATLDTITNTAAIKLFDEDNFHQFTATVKAGIKNEKTDAAISFRRTDQLTDYDKSAYKYNDPFGSFPTTWYDGNNTLDFARNIFGYNINQKINTAFEIIFSGGYSTTLRAVLEDSTLLDAENTIYDPTYYSGTNTGAQFQNEMRANWKKKNITVSAGAGQQYESMNIQTYFYTNGFFGPFELKSNLDSLNIHSELAHVFVQTEVNGSLISNKLNGLNLLLGGRINMHSEYGNNFTFEINPYYKFSANTMLYASVSSGFNPPSLYQLYSPDANYISLITRGNPLLEPETSVSYEIGLKQKIKDKIFFTLSAYSTVVNNSIEYVYLWDGTIPIDSLGTDFLRDDFRGDTYLNMGTQKITGIDGEFGMNICRKVSAGFNFNILKGNLFYSAGDISAAQTQNNHVQLYNSGEFINADVKIDELVRRANTGSAYVSWQAAKKINLKLAAQYTGAHRDIFYDYALGPYGALNSNEIDAYTLFNLQLRYSILKTFNISASIKNIFDEKFTEIYGFATLGRSFYLKLDYSF